MRLEPYERRLLNAMMHEASQHRGATVACEDILRGWRFTFYREAGRYRFTAQLYPNGRLHTTDDWSFLGMVVVCVGAPLDETVLLRTLPNDPHEWQWNDKPVEN